MRQPPSFPPRSSHPQNGLEGSHAHPIIVVPGTNDVSPTTPSFSNQPNTSFSNQPNTPNLSATLNPAPVTPTEEPFRKNRRFRPIRRVLLTLLLLLVALALVVTLWGVFLVHRVDSRIKRLDALSTTASAPGTTWLIAGSDSREGLINDGTQGERSDSILLVHEAPNGKTAMISLPRDTYAKIPGKGYAKLNAAFSWGGAPLLVRSVENLTGLKVNHYIQVGMSGVAKIVDALGGVNLCWDQSFNDRLTGLAWQAGCHESDGNTALSFSRMRYSDPLGDIGRTRRQRLVIAAVLKKSLSSAVIFSPSKQVLLADAGASTLSVDRDLSTWDIVRLVLAMKKATTEGMQGVPPIASLGYNPGHAVGSTVLLDPQKTPSFFARLANGQLTPADLRPQF